MNRDLWRAFFVAVLVVLIQVGCDGRSPQIGPDLGARPNVILVLVDALRPDRLGPYGFTDRPTTPNLDRLAADGVVFERAISQAGWTVPSIASLFTGVYPKTHGVYKFIRPDAHLSVGGSTDDSVLLEPLSSAHDTLAEQFRAAGYATSAILKSDVVNAGRGYDQGFDHFEFIDRKPKDRGESGAHLTDATIAWIDGHYDVDRPFFLYLHYMDTHASYQAPKPLYDTYATGIDSDLDGSVMPIRAFNDGKAVATDDDVAKLLALYDAEIEYWDLQLGRLMAYLDDLGMLDNTIIAITADHGEAFNEHGKFLHAGLYQENIAVPLIIAGSGLEERRVAGWVEMIALGPTLVDLAGVPQGSGWVIPSLAAVARGQAELQPTSVYSEWAGQRCVIDPGGLKLLLVPGEIMLFDLVGDPGETTNLAAQRPDEVERLTGLIRDWQRAAEAFGERFPRSPAETLTEEQIEALKALGYL
jgi:arylsulfatase A-like enzyme